MPARALTNVLLVLVLIGTAITSRPAAAAAACAPGTVMSAGACIALAMPEHAHANFRGDGWVCDFGFERHGQLCAPIIVPRNAARSRNSDLWKCNSGYYEIRGICLPDETAAANSAHASPPLDLKALRGVAERQLAAHGGRRDGTFVFIVMLSVMGIGVVATILVSSLFMIGRRPQTPVVEIPHQHSFRPQQAVAAGAWLTYGERIDGLTGGPIAEGAAVTQCPTCQVCYGPESVAVLRRENRARCLACNSRILRKAAQIKFETLRDTTGATPPQAALPAR